MKNALIVSAIAFTSIASTITHAELVDYQVIFQTVYITQRDPDTNLIVEIPNNDVWYGLFSIDSIYQYSPLGYPAENFTASIGGIIFNTTPNGFNFQIMD